MVSVRVVGEAASGWQLQLRARRRDGDVVAEANGLEAGAGVGLTRLEMQRGGGECAPAHALAGRTRAAACCHEGSRRWREEPARPRSARPVRTRSQHWRERRNGGAGARSTSQVRETDITSPRGASSSIRDIRTKSGALRVSPACRPPPCLLDLQGPDVGGQITYAQECHLIGSLAPEERAPDRHVHAIRAREAPSTPR